MTDHDPRVPMDVPGGEVAPPTTEAAGPPATPLAPWLAAPPDPSPEPPAAPTGARPGPLEIVSRGLDLNVTASGDIRRIAILIGLLTLATVGPLVAIVLAIGTTGGFDWIVDLANGVRPQAPLIPSSAGAAFFVVALIGAFSAGALSIDSQLLAVLVTASKAVGRPFDLRAALQIARMRFWRLWRANILNAVILLIPNFVVEQLVAGGRRSSNEAQFVVLTLVGVVLSVPFAYLSTWIVLGAVGARESVRRSWRLARSRLSLALVIAIVNTAVATLAAFALGSGADIVVRIVTALGLGEATGAVQGIVLLGIIALAVVAVGSLSMTIAALTAGPQVVAFLGLTGITSGLNAVHDPDNPFATPHREPLVSRPMKIAIVIEVLIALSAVLTILR